MADLLKPTKRRYVFAMYLLSGYLPWGHDFGRSLSGERKDPPSIGRWRDHFDRRWAWPLCCGQVMSDAEVKAWTDAGLVVEVVGTEHCPRRIVAGPKLETWTCDAFEHMGMRSRKAA